MWSRFFDHPRSFGLFGEEALLLKGWKIDFDNSPFVTFQFLIAYIMSQSNEILKEALDKTAYAACIRLSI